MMRFGFNAWLQYLAASAFLGKISREYASQKGIPEPVLQDRRRTEIENRIAQAKQKWTLCWHVVKFWLVLYRQRRRHCAAEIIKDFTIQMTEASRIRVNAGRL